MSFHCTPINAAQMCKNNNELFLSMREEAAAPAENRREGGGREKRTRWGQEEAGQSGVPQSLLGPLSRAWHSEARLCCKHRLPAFAHKQDCSVLPCRPWEMLLSSPTWKHTGSLSEPAMFMKSTCEHIKKQMNWNGDAGEPRACSSLPSRGDRGLPITRTGSKGRHPSSSLSAWGVA